MRLVMRVFETMSPDLVDLDHEYRSKHSETGQPDPRPREVTAIVRREADEWEPVPDPLECAGLNDRKKERLEIYAKDELHAFHMWLTFKKGEYEEWDMNAQTDT